MQQTVPAAIGQILCAEGAITPADVASGLAAQNALHTVDLEATPSDAALAREIPRAIWLRFVCLPWMRLGGTILMACSDPAVIPALRKALPATYPPILPVIATEQNIFARIAAIFKPELIALAETRVAPEYSCRHWTPVNPRQIAMIGFGLAALATAASFAAAWVFAVLCLVGVVSLVQITLLKMVATTTQIAAGGHRRAGLPERPDRLPKFSVMVPLFRETEIAEALVRRLQNLSYPKALLDIVLVLEEKDRTTRATLESCTLPPWMRVIEVPDGGGITTKPRALNYALDFCRGQIVGIWDAEDAPERDQLEQVAAHFARADPDVVCLQGFLDYYNPRANWISRCFTMEYAGWFRVVLPGLARLGLVLPLGGTTLFLRRDKIIELGGWDAHNVTEDADLGVRIARCGYRTEVVATTTYEEANCRPWRWIKQRSRWLKGFMVTYAVHMRHPKRTLADLGWKRFIGLNMFFVGTLSQFLLAPLLWSFWSTSFAVAHPVTSTMGAHVSWVIGALFVLAEVVNISIALFAVHQKERRFLMPWAITLPLYFPIGTIAAYKALYELLFRPFYWDKTQHGQSQPDAASAPGQIAAQHRPIVD